MNLFLSYASENCEVAKAIYFALVGAGHQVFFDHPSLLPSDNYDKRLSDAVKSADGLVFLISPNSVQIGRYTLTELKYAEHKWPHPQNRVLPVIVQPTDFKSIPAYLKAVTILEPVGNIAAETVEAVNNLVIKPSNNPSPTETNNKQLGILQKYGSLFTFAFASFSLSVCLGTLFSFIYPTVIITPNLASLFVMASLLIVFMLRMIFRIILQLNYKRFQK